MTLSAAICALALAAPAKPTGLRPDYLALLLDYARGARAEAIAGLGAFGQGELERQLGPMEKLVRAAELCRCPTPLQGVPLRAAVMLHADRDRAERPAGSEAEQPRPCPGAEARLASRYADLAARVPESRDFARRFYLGMTMRAQWDYCLGESLRFGQAGIQLFPRDPELLLAVGSVYEEGATLGMVASETRISGLPAGQHDNIQASANERQKWMVEARRFLTDAVSADPKSELAELRLGRVLFRLGESEPAQSALTRLAERSRDPAILFLAHLFLGRVHEDAGRVPEAVAEYRLALGIDPLSQSAAVALAQALQLGGEAEEARGVLARAVSAAGRRSRRDGYWDYLIGNALPLEDLLAALRQETLE